MRLSLPLQHVASRLLCESRLIKAGWLSVRNNVTPLLLRTSNHAEKTYLGALDAGAHGIVVPLLRTAEEARSIVRAAKFPPQGTRGFGSPFSMEKFGGVSMEEYFAQANGSLLTMVQIETREALDNVDEIADVPGVDVLLVGPFDLGNNIGFPIRGGTMAPELQQAIAKVLQSGKTHKKPTAIYAVNGAQARHFAEQGFEMISVVNDVGALQMYMSSALATARGS